MDDDDGALDEIEKTLLEIHERIALLYEQVWDAYEAGATHTQLEEVTGFSRGTVQNLLKGHPVRIGPHHLTRLKLAEEFPDTYT